MRKYVVGAIAGLVVLVIGIIWYWPDADVHLVVCDVGQGDGIVIWRGSAQVVVDGGPNEKIVDCLSKYVPFWDRRIEMIMMTNGDADHMTGLISLIKRYKIDQIVANNLVSDTGRFGELRKEIVEEKMAVHAPQQGEVIKLGGMEFKVLWPAERLGSELVWSKEADDRVLGVNSYSKTEANEQSVVLKLIYGGFSVLLTGDIGSETEQVLVNFGSNLRSNVLKVGHHGSKYSSSEEFLRAVKPALAVISVGKKNRYGHPTQEALERLQVVGARILRTDESGDIEIVSDGERLWIR